MLFENKVVVVTGGARGQGEAEVRALARRGARVVIGDVLDEEGSRLATELGARTRFVRHDVSDERSWRTVMTAAAEWGGCHALVNNAGVLRIGGLHQTSVESFDLHVRVNQLGCFLGMKCSAPLMAESGGGSIVNVSSSAGLRAAPGAIAYSATKWAVRGMTKAAAAELAASGIRVNSIHPGPIATEMLSFQTPGERAARIDQVPLRRMGTVDEVASLVVFLVSDDSSYITGAEIAVDGGVTL
ncbi:MAG TPA: glucose 1-dehydrogenase [Streptosporangiaceae bacterium]|nr:glucose 1-dehydrogenase [Streptosporangiaceae bacterium]